METSGLPSLLHMQCTCAPSHTHTCTHSGYISHLTIFSHLKEAQACPYEAIRGQMTNTGIPGARQPFSDSPVTIRCHSSPSSWSILGPDVKDRATRSFGGRLVWMSDDIWPLCFFLVKPLLLRQCHLNPGLAFGA